MKRPAAVLLALALTGSLAACGDDDPREPVASSSSDAPSAAPEPDAPSSPAAQPAPSPSPSAATSAAGGSTEPVTQEPSGGPLSVRQVRVARQDGFDRVVFELAGKDGGAPGWTVGYETDPSQQGSGDPVEVDGEHVLAIRITGAGYPFDTGVEEFPGDPELPGDLEVVQDVVAGSVFEGQYEAYVGTSRRAAFTVTRLANPARVVVDVRHG